MRIRKFCVTDPKNKKSIWSQPLVAVLLTRMIRSNLSFYLQMKMFKARLVWVYSHWGRLKMIEVSQKSSHVCLWQLFLCKCVHGDPGILASIGMNLWATYISYLLCSAGSPLWVCQKLMKSIIIRILLRFPFHDTFYHANWSLQFRCQVFGHWPFILSIAFSSLWKFP